MFRGCLRIAALGCGVVLSGATVLAAPVSVTRVSNPNVLDPTCDVGPAAGGFLYRNSEVEPFVATNPADAGNLIGAWQQDRWSNGGAAALVAGITTNGGATWTQVALPFDRCAAASNPVAARYTRASDPWVSIGPDGTAYAISLSVNFANNDNAVLAATSTDKGLTWSNVTSIKADAGTSAIIPTVTRFFNDKESVTADPTRRGFAYAVWDRIESPSAQFEANVHAAAFHGPTWFSRTTDGGKTWSPGRIIFDPGTQNQTLANFIVVGPNGTLYDFFDLLVSHRNAKGLRGASVAMIRSTDAGVTWSNPIIISSDQSIGVVDPNNVNPATNVAPAPLRVGSNVPYPAVDANSGHLYVVWEDSRFSGGSIDEIAVSRSVDGGLSWSNPARVNTPTSQAAFTPSVAVISGGTVGVSYYQLRPSTPGSLPTDYFIKRFSGSLLSAATPGVEGLAAEAVTANSPTAGPFNMLDAPFARGYFTGDYEGLTVRGETFAPFYVQTNCQDRSCSALTSVVSPADRAPTGNNSTDVYAGGGF
jgi:hypothetical protein